MEKEELFDKFREELDAMTHINAAIGVLFWDQKVFMPPKGIEFRAKTISSLSGIIHKKFVSLNFEKLLLKIKNLFEGGQLDDREGCIFREVWRNFEREKKLSTEFVKELSLVCSMGQNAWIQAKKKSNFKIFSPYLKKIVELKRKEAEMVGFKVNPYDALLDTYEPNMTTEEIAIIFEELKKFLVPFLRKIKYSHVEIDPGILKGSFTPKKQVDFNSFVAKKIGFDFNAGRLDISAHPFTTNFNALDVRMTTRFRKDDLIYSLLSTIHESGHAIYEQGILADNFILWRIIGQMK